MSSQDKTSSKTGSNNIKKSKFSFESFRHFIKSHALVISIMLVIIGLIGLGVVKAMDFASGKILPEVTVAGIEVGGKTQSEAEKIVQAHVASIENQGPTITYDNQSINSKLKDMGVSFNANQAVSDAYRFGRSGNWKTRIADNSKLIVNKHNISLTPQADKTKLDAYLTQITKEATVAPVDATLVVQDGQISVTPSKAGRGVDQNKLKNDLTALIDKNALNNSKIALATSALNPNIIEPGTVDARAQAEKYMLSAPINIVYNDRTYVANKSIVGSWIAFNASGNKLVASISDSALNSWGNTVAKKIQIAKVDRVVMDGTGQVLDEGQDGLGVDTKTLNSNIKSRVLSASTGSTIAVITYAIPKGEVSRNPHAQPCRFDGRYIDINLSEQTLYAFEGCTLVNQFLISSGKTGPTPTGQFYVYNKQTVTEMKGPGYDLPGVQWVSWWSGDYSIHGTYWHHNFGHPMSHGCINASNDNALWIFNWDDIGTPVYIHW